MDWEGEQRIEWLVHRKKYISERAGDSHHWKEEIGLSPC